MIHCLLQIFILARSSCKQGLSGQSLSVISDNHRITVSKGKDSEPTDPDPCQYKGLAGYGGRLIIFDGGKQGYVKGVELFGMGQQTDILRRYPIHFHILCTDGCNDCYFRHSSVYQSIFRCVSIH